MNEQLKRVLSGLITELRRDQRDAAWEWVCGGGSKQIDYPGVVTPDPLHGAEAATEADLDEVIRSVWQGLGYNDRKRLGSVYTTINVVDKILDEVGYDGRPTDIIVDPACGAGAFVIRAAERKFKQSKQKNINQRIKEVFDCVIGADISAEPGRVCRTLLRALVLNWAALKNKQSELDFGLLNSIHPIVLKVNSWKDELKEEIHNALPDKKSSGWSGTHLTWRGNCGTNSILTAVKWNEDSHLEKRRSILVQGRPFLVLQICTWLFSSLEKSLLRKLMAGFHLSCPTNSKSPNTHSISESDCEKRNV